MNNVNFQKGKKQQSQAKEEEKKYFENTNLDLNQKAYTFSFYSDDQLDIPKLDKALSLNNIDLPNALPINFDSSKKPWLR